MTSDQEYEILTIVFSSFNDFHEMGRIGLAAGGIKKDLPRSPMFSKEIEPLKHDLAHGAIDIARASFQELGSNRIRMHIARLTDVVHQDSHASHGTAKY